MTNKRKGRKTNLAYTDENGKLKFKRNTYLQVKEHTEPTAYQDHFVGYFKHGIETILDNLHTVSAYRIVHALLLEVIEKKSYKLYLTQAKLAEQSKVIPADVCRILKQFKDLEIILHQERGLIVINPKFFWRGNITSWGNAVEETEEIYQPWKIVEREQELKEIEEEMKKHCEEQNKI